MEQRGALCLQSIDMRMKALAQGVGPTTAGALPRRGRSAGEGPGGSCGESPRLLRTTYLPLKKCISEECRRDCNGSPKTAALLHLEDVAYGTVKSRVSHKNVDVRYNLDMLDSARN